MTKENIQEPKNIFVPMVQKTIEGKETTGDIFSQLLKDFIVLVHEDINPDSAKVIISSLLYLESIDSKREIKMYINSPGGHISAGLAIYDTMNAIDNPVSTIGMGMCASMGSFLLSAGEPGKRYALPNTEIMIHQPLGGAQGQATEIEIAATHINKLKRHLTDLYAAHSTTGFSAQQFEPYLDRDYFMFPTEARDKFGIIDEIIRKPELSNREPSEEVTRMGQKNL